MGVGVNHSPQEHADPAHALHRMNLPIVQRLAEWNSTIHTLHFHDLPPRLKPPIQDILQDSIPRVQDRQSISRELVAKCKQRNLNHCGVIGLSPWG